MKQEIIVKNGYGFNIMISRDECGQDESPRDWENLGTMVCRHKNYNLGDKDHDFSNDCSIDDAIEQLKYKHGEKGFVFKIINMHEHTELSISTSSGYPFNDVFDSGVLGFIFCTNSDIRKGYEIPDDQPITAEHYQKAEAVLETEVAIYNQFLSGDIYCYLITPMNDPDYIMESCGGFYGQDNAKEAALETVDCLVDERNKERQSKLKELIRNRVPLFNRLEAMAY